MNKELIFIVSFLLLFSVIFTVDANEQFEKPKWHEGDYWKYETIERETASDLMIEAKQMTNLNINGIDVNVRIVTHHTDYDDSSFPFGIDNVLYYNESDMSIVKLIYESSDTRAETIFSSPFLEFDYPIYVGKEWEVHTKATVTSIEDTDEGYIHRYNQVTGVTDVNTKAGFFRCYIVKSWGDEIGEVDEYTLYYISEEVGQPPVMVEGYEFGERYSIRKLVEFKYAKLSDSSFINDDTPGFEVVLLVIALISLIMIVRKKS